MSHCAIHIVPAKGKQTAFKCAEWETNETVAKRFRQFTDSQFYVAVNVSNEFRTFEWMNAWVNNVAEASLKNPAILGFGRKSNNWLNVSVWLVWCVPLLAISIISFFFSIAIGGDDRVSVQSEFKKNGKWFAMNRWNDRSSSICVFFLPTFLSILRTPPFPQMNDDIQTQYIVALEPKKNG